MKDLQFVFTTKHIPKIVKTSHHIPIGLAFLLFLLANDAFSLR